MRDETVDHQEGRDGCNQEGRGCWKKVDAQYQAQK
jgi:hypothetical protein